MIDVHSFRSLLLGNMWLEQSVFLSCLCCCTTIHVCIIDVANELERRFPLTLHLVCRSI